MNIGSELESFANRLTTGGFGDFFVYPMHDETIEKVWADPRNHQLLDNLLSDSKVSDRAKFLACEVFFEKDVVFMQRHAPEYIAEIYAHALSGNFTGMANSWGLLYERQDDGPVGIAFLRMGEKAIPALSGLLDDARSVLTYHGSKEATLGNGYVYRIKDFAAYYLGRILGNPLKYYPDLVDRDDQIETLKKSLRLHKFERD